MSEANNESGSLIELTTLAETHAEGMSSLARRLDSLISSREDEFLALGSSLMEFTVQSGEISTNAAELASTCAGEDVSARISALESALGDLQQSCGTDAIDGGTQALQRIRGLVETLDKHVGEFSRIIRSLQMLGISTRIESARLGDQGMGFSTLADDVETLASKIVQDSGSIMGKSHELGGLLVSAGEQTRQLGHRQAECSEHITRDIREALDTLNALLEHASGVSESLNARSTSVEESVSEVVSSLQFHDIVRQQVEHVEEALSQMETQAEEGPCIGKEGDEALQCWRNVVGWMADVSELQVSQLDNASERFRTAVSSLRDGLLRIAETTREIMQDVAGVMGAGNEDGQTVFSHVVETTGHVVDAMQQFSRQSEEIASLIGSVAGTVSQMADFVSDIEEVGAEIELIALNASIKAAHTGEEGKALGVLAQAIQRLSVEARECTSSVSSVLKEIDESSRQLEDISSDTTQRENLEQYSKVQRRFTAELDQMDKDMSAKVRELKDGSRRFADAVSGLAKSITLHDEICPGLDSAADELRGIVKAIRAVVPVDDDENRPARLKELLSRYTMEVERLVHESAFGCENDENSCDDLLRHKDEGEVELFGGDDADASGDADGDDWDNVDLF